MDAKAKALQALGENVIGFGAGEPDFPTPEHIVEAAVVACRDPKTHKYTPTGGLPALREALAEKTRRDSGLEVTPSQILVTNGGKQAIANAFAVLCDPGDEVLVPGPVLDHLSRVDHPGRRGSRGHPHRRSRAGSGSRSPSSRRPGPRRPRCFCSSRRPTPPDRCIPARRSRPSGGGPWTIDIWVITDEIYEHLTYGGVEHHSMPVVVPELVDRCIVVNGVAKTYSMTGWRVGWLIGPTDVVTAATNLQSHETSNVANVSQRAALAAVGRRPVSRGRDARRLRSSPTDHPHHAQ